MTFVGVRESILEPETPHWLCHRPTRLHTCSMAIPAGWESDWACTCTCTHIDATHAMFISSRWSSPDPPRGLKKKDPRKEHSRTTGTQTKKATLNPKTKKPFCKETIYDIFETECYDVDPLAPWVNKARLSQKTCNQQPQTHDRREVE